MLRKYIIEKLGGFADIDSAIASLRESGDERTRSRILTEAVKHLFNAISSEDILKEQDGHLTFRGRSMTQAEEDLLRAEAQQFMRSTLWRVLRMDIRWQINKKMFVESTVATDVLWGKLLLFYDDIVKTRLQQLTGQKIDTII